ncbi:MAG: hypothetical protein JNL22_03690 [Bacteroidales bacterium]|nr:hypothetical protein [Bacteroidales bacterium]
MKRTVKTLKSLLPLIILSAFTLLIGCTKEKSEKQVSLTEATESEYVVNKVLDFSRMATDLKAGKLLKNAEKMPIDTALYYISATLNYTYCYHTANYGKLRMDTITIKVPILGIEEKTFLVDALAGFNDAVAKARAKFVKIDELTKKLINVAFLNAEINQDMDTVSLSLGLQIGIGNGQTISSSGSFNVDEQYWWLRDSQNCFDGNYLSGGAPNVLEQHLLFKYILAPPANCRYWFPYTQVKNFIATDYPGDGTPDYFCDYKIFYASGPNQQVLTNTVQCLGIETNHPDIHEMEYYLNGLDQIIAEFLLNSGKSAATIIIGSEFIPINYDNSTIKHSPQLTYGVKEITCWESEYPIGIE